MAQARAHAVALVPVPILLAGVILLAGLVSARNLALATGARRQLVPGLPRRSPPRSPPPLTTPLAAPAALGMPIQASARCPAPAPDRSLGPKPGLVRAQIPSRMAGLAREPTPGSGRGPGRNIRPRCVLGRAPPPSRRGPMRNLVPARPGSPPRRARLGLRETTGRRLVPAALARMRSARRCPTVGLAHGMAHGTAGLVPGATRTTDSDCRRGSQESRSWGRRGGAVADGAARLPLRRRRHVSSDWRRRSPARAGPGGGRPRTGRPTGNRPMPRCRIAVARRPHGRVPGAASAGGGSCCWPSCWSWFSRRGRRPR